MRLSSPSVSLRTQRHRYFRIIVVIRISGLRHLIALSQSYRVSRRHDSPILVDPLPFTRFPARILLRSVNTIVLQHLSIWHQPVDGVYDLAVNYLIVTKRVARFVLLDQVASVDRSVVDHA